MNNQLDYYKVVMLTVSRKSRIGDLYTLAMSLLPNIKGLHWNIYRMSIEGEISVNPYEEETIRMIKELALKTDNVIAIEDVGYKMSVAEVKGMFFGVHNVGSNKWVISADDDFVFPYNTLYNIKSILDNVVDFNDKVFLYSTIDIYNARKHGDYIGDKVSVEEATTIVKEHGSGVLSHLRVKNLVGTSYAHYFLKLSSNLPTLIPTQVGGAGFIIHSEAVNNRSITALMNFYKGERGHDIHFCSFYSDRYLICDTEVWHTGINEPFYNKYWTSYNPEVEKLYNSN